jgi:hypothetical protein
METLLVRALCQAPADAQRERFLSEIRGYQPQDAEHRLILDALIELAEAPNQDLRKILPAQLTRAGFPDVDVNPYFAPMECADDSLLSLAKESYGALKAKGNG